MEVLLSSALLTILIGCAAEENDGKRVVPPLEIGCRNRKSVASTVKCQGVTCAAGTFTTTS